jgi:hypothetical protein
MPLQHRHSYAAGIQRGLRDEDLFQSQEFPAQLQRVRVAAQPRSTRFELEGGLRGFRTLVSHVHLFVLLAGPGPSGSAGPSRRCQGCSRLHLRLQVRATLSFVRLLRQPDGGVLSSPHGQTAPRGARGPLPSGPGRHDPRPLQAVADIDHPGDLAPLLGPPSGTALRPT